ncbi:transcriptional regulator family: Centromere protein B DNA-binding region [Penicillium angulare]|uniref:transcriptional regulator family: Centromere protein B DNA-binding region n=1 Tax=Penicillium angulare TaxID=116970 RepID=UPI00254194A0|nr:transcriptional regulator family: Centromere protein B DNA-binding region [Penicillium angulare]KAJ5260482.1 transcriptional regulator family: Centromere protein B DNA-binding region [Penicillium angulare]
MAKPTETEVSRVNQAIKYARSLKKPNLSAISKEYGVDYKLLWRRVKQNMKPKTDVKPSNYALNVQQEKALGYWIQAMDAAFIPPTPNIIEQWANATLARSKTPDRTVGKDWVYRYIKRFPDTEMKLRRQKIVDSKRLGAADVSMLYHWYDLLAKALDGVHPRLIYNFDETGFHIGQGRTQRVFSSRMNKSQQLASNEHGERVTVAECIAADGWRMHPLIIFKGQHHMESWYDHILPDEWMTATAEKGYIVDELAVLWIQEFDRETRNRVNKNEQRILLVDGCGSHLTFEFLNIAEKANIKIFGFPPNRTNYLQPLDGKPFQAYKAYFRSQNNLISQWGGGQLATKSSFLHDLLTFRDKALTSRICRNAFKDRGIYPPDAEIVCKPLDNSLPEPLDLEIDLRNEKTLSPGPDLLSSSLENTPSKTFKDVEKRQRHLSGLLDRSNITPKEKKTLSQVLEEQEFYFNALANTSATIAEMARFKAPREKKITKRHILGLRDDGMIRVKDAKRSIAARHTKEAEKEEKRLAREWKKNHPNSTTPFRSEAEKDAEAEPLYNETGEVIGFFDKF